MDLVIALSEQQQQRGRRQKSLVSGARIGAASTLNAAQVSASIHEPSWSGGAQTAASMGTNSNTTTSIRAATRTPATTAPAPPPMPAWLVAMREDTNRSISYMASLIKGKA